MWLAEYDIQLNQDSPPCSNIIILIMQFQCHYLLTFSSVYCFFPHSQIRSYTVPLERFKAISKVCFHNSVTTNLMGSPGNFATSYLYFLVVASHLFKFNCLIMWNIYFKFENSVTINALQLILMYIHNLLLGIYVDYYYQKTSFSPSVCALDKE